MLKPYSAADVAGALGISIDTFYRTRGWRHDNEQMPRPISKRGKLRFERSGMDAWLARHHPQAPKLFAANDSAPPIAPHDSDGVSAFMATHYGRKG